MKNINLINELKIYANQSVNLVYKSIAEFLLNNMEKALTIKLEEIASNCNCAQASVIKFAKKLGFVGTKDLLPAIERNYSFWKFHNQRDFHASNDIAKLQQINDYHNLTKENIEYVFNFNRNALLQAAKILKKSKHIILVGKGANLEAINIFAGYLSKLNYHVDYSYDFEVQEKWIEKFHKDSVIIFFSFSGVHKDIDKILDHAQNKKMQIICFTSNHESQLFQKSNVAFITKSNEDVLPKHTSARIAFTYLSIQLINLIK